MLDAGWFTGRAAIVTGATSGIGRGVALVCSAAGSRVVALDRNPTDEPGLEATLVVDVRSAGAVVELTRDYGGA